MEDFDFDYCDVCGSHRCPSCGEMTCFGCSCDNEEVEVEEDEAYEEIQYGVNYEYLSTHTFYGKTGTPDILQKYGFDIELDNWDK